MKTTQEMKNEFQEIVQEFSKITGLPVESVVQVATLILQESGKDRRAEIYSQANLNKNNFYSKTIRNGNVPATDDQKKAMDNFKLEYSENITKAEASDKISKAIEEAKSRKKGGVSPASSSHY